MMNGKVYTSLRADDIVVNRNNGELYPKVGVSCLASLCYSVIYLAKVIVITEEDN